MNVLSLFDGMSCGQIALERASIHVDRYYASEVDKYAIQVTQQNHPNTIQLGDVTNWKEWDIDWSSIELLLGGSPCQGFSFAGKQLAFDDPRSKLFLVYVDILNHIKSVNPNIKFLLENVRMKKEYLDIISEQLGVGYTLINSALVSAQNRNRFYWANWKFEQPDNKGTILADVIDDISEYTSSSEHNRYDLGINRIASAVDIKGHDYNKRVYDVYGKSPTLAAASGGNLEPKIVTTYGYRKLTPLECERLQTVPDNYTASVSNRQRYRMLGNGWTVDVIAHILKQLKETI